MYTVLDKLLPDPHLLMCIETNNKYMDCLFICPTTSFSTQPDVVTKLRTLFILVYYIAMCSPNDNHFVSSNLKLIHNSFPRGRIRGKKKGVYPVL